MRPWLCARPCPPGNFSGPTQAGRGVEALSLVREGLRPALDPERFGSDYVMQLGLLQCFAMFCKLLWILWPILKT